jgi:multidrug efflux pump subunit AcrA (membrane-fusion protein)
VRTGADVAVTFDVLGEGETFQGRISYVGAVVDPRSRTFPNELSLANPGGLIKPEMVADVSVVRRTLEDVVVVPQEALIRVEEGYVVFLVEEDGGTTVVRSQVVELGPAQLNRVVIQGGLEVGDRLVVVGQQSVAAGDRVNVVAER